MLADELDRQKRLRALLAADGASSKRDEKQIVENYKHLQFCDTFALYFHLRHPNERAHETYIHVPMNKDADASLMLKKIDDASYSLNPFSFAQDTVTFTCRGRYMRPVAPDEEPDDLGTALYALATECQTYRVVPG
jgi:hypothetical protein